MNPMVWREHLNLRAGRNLATAFTALKTSQGAPEAEYAGAKSANT